MFVCLLACLRVSVSHPNCNGQTLKLYMFGILRVLRASSRNFFSIIPVLNGVMGRFVQGGGSDRLILWATQSARVSFQVLKSATSSEDSDRTLCREG